MFDFKPQKDPQGNHLKSFISYNGLDYSNIKNKNIKYSNNLLKDSKWAVNVHGARFDTRSFFKKFR